MVDALNGLLVYYKRCNDPEKYERILRQKKMLLKESRSNSTTANSDFYADSSGNEKQRQPSGKSYLSTSASTTDNSPIIRLAEPRRDPFLARKEREQQERRDNNSGEDESGTDEKAHREDRKHRIKMNKDQYKNNELVSTTSSSTILELTTSDVPSLPQYSDEIELDVLDKGTDELLFMKLIQDKMMDVIGHGIAAGVAALANTNVLDEKIKQFGQQKASICNEESYAGRISEIPHDQRQNWDKLKNQYSITSSTKSPEKKPAVEKKSQSKSPEKKKEEKLEKKVEEKKEQKSKKEEEKPEKKSKKNSKNFELKLDVTQREISPQDKHHDSISITISPSQPPSVVAPAYVAIEPKRVKPGQVQVHKIYVEPRYGYTQKVDSFLFGHEGQPMHTVVKANNKRVQEFFELPILDLSCSHSSRTRHTSSDGNSQWDPQSYSQELSAIHSPDLRNKVYRRMREESDEAVKPKAPKTSQRKRVDKQRKERRVLEYEKMEDAKPKPKPSFEMKMPCCSSRRPTGRPEDRFGAGGSPKSRTMSLDEPSGRHARPKKNTVDYTVMPRATVIKTSDGAVINLAADVFDKENNLHHHNIVSCLQNFEPAQVNANGKEMRRRR
ncbi:unnamed protein product [Bursaphelenchus okinawaensis]|uniref:Uncharacterized protein n=1 Tax=Bursaphelenchus okinawaensis TaxID=465554 RepID=A0A811KCB0_9BILA|nr:unnamed protein product [Bursaphelenchus okinawaensis]CAG9100821.1 unnamed protein product [Bursaphelenchus okinawaensis]